MMGQMFHKDFKQHLKAIETLAAYIDTDLEGLIANLDLVSTLQNFSSSSKTQPENKLDCLSLASLYNLA
jgi:hypothetical protein